MRIEFKILMSAILMPKHFLPIICLDVYLNVEQKIHRRILSNILIIKDRIKARKLLNIILMYKVKCNVVLYLASYGLIII